MHLPPACILTLCSSYVLWLRQVQILESFPQAREQVSRVGKSWAWRFSRISPLGSIAHRGLVFIANTGQVHCILLFCMRPPRAPLCFQHFCNPAWPPLSCMQSQTLLRCLFMMMAPIFHPLFPQVYAALSFLIPGAQCTSCHDCSLLFEFIFSLSYQEVLLSPL